MSSKPDYLDGFPFIQDQWQNIAPLLSQYEKLESFEIKPDWDKFLQQHPYQDIFFLTRKYRQYRLAFIGVMDMIQPYTDHLNAMHAISAVADHLLEVCYQYCNEQMKAKLGQLRNRQGDVVSLMVFALGKLGSGELNYSSDIDLVFVYPEKGQSDGNRALDGPTFFEKFGRMLINVLDQFTTDGRVYRVDMRLRPFGSAGALACSAVALNQYLLHEGREWERFVWMRARLVCGDQSKADDLMRQVQPFIYRKHLDYSVFDSLAKIKNEINEFAKTKSDDLKIGCGGIREIEFVVQSLQMAFGGRLVQLQNHMIFPAIKLLYQAGKLTQADALQLSDAWLFLRKCENLCQLRADEQVHVLPENSIQLVAIQKAMGFGDDKSFNQKLKQAKTTVSSIFSSLFAEQSGKLQTKPSEGQLAVIASQLCEQTVSGRISQENKDKIQQLFVKILSKKPTKKVLENMQLIIRAISKRPSYVMMLNHEKLLLQKLLDLVKDKYYFTVVIARYPALLELLFENEKIPEMPDQCWFDQQWQDKLKKPPKDEEQWMEFIRFYKTSMQFRLMQQLTSGGMSQQKTSLAMTALAEFVLQKVVTQAWQETTDRIGQSSIANDQLFIIAYGSMANRSMQLNSDLDLVYIYDLILLEESQAIFISRWIKRINHHLTTQLFHGKLYDIDVQLRPDGDSGTQVSSFNKFKHYQQDKAWLWEHAALIKTRVVYGTEQQKNKFNQLRKNILTKKRDAKKVDKELITMQTKLIKHHRDKNHDDLLILGMVLKSAHRYPKIIESSQINDLLASLVKHSILNKKSATQIKNRFDARLNRYMDTKQQDL
ncbi:MAG: hypothetical protein L3J52_04885 [Proteobacteria bacterium]|nr:hypothetical protein [Pseudomonadota bacterium]